jgi:hypothetical protein
LKLRINEHAPELNDLIKVVSFRAISRVSIKLKTSVSEISSVTVIMVTGG